MPTHPLAEGCPCNRLGPVNSLQYHPTNKKQGLETSYGSQPLSMSMRRVSLGLVGGLLGSGLGGRLNWSFSGGGLLDRSLGSGGDLGGGLSFLDDSLLRAYRLGDELDDGGRRGVALARSDLDDTGVAPSRCSICSAI